MKPLKIHIAIYKIQHKILKFIKLRSYFDSYKETWLRSYNNKYRKNKKSGCLMPEVAKKKILPKFSENTVEKTDNKDSKLHTVLKIIFLRLRSIE